MNTMPPTDALDLTAILGSEADCADRLAAMWMAADVHAAYPASTETVVELLRSAAAYLFSVGSNTDGR